MTLSKIPVYTKNRCVQDLEADEWPGRKERQNPACHTVRSRKLAGQDLKDFIERPDRAEQHWVAEPPIVLVLLNLE